MMREMDTTGYMEGAEALCACTCTLDQRHRDRLGMEFAGTGGWFTITDSETAR